MGFDRETWKANVTAQLQDWRLRMKQVGAKSIYGFLSMASLWPVVEAARGGEWAALSALGGVVANVGGNLLASRLQSWKDEATAVHHIEAELSADPSLRAELDAVLETLDVFSQAQQRLTEAERQWFIKTLREELAQQGNLERFAGHLIGSGAIAQHRSTAAGERGIAVGGLIQDSTIVTGTLTQNVYGGAAVNLSSNPPPSMEVVTPGSCFGRMDSPAGRVALLLKVKFRNTSEQPTLINSFRIQYMGDWHAPMVYMGTVGLYVASGILAAGMHLEENIDKSPSIPAMDIIERAAFFLLPDPPEPFPGPNKLHLTAEASFISRSPRRITFTLTDQGRLSQC